MMLKSSLRRGRRSLPVLFSLLVVPVAANAQPAEADGEATEPAPASDTAAPTEPPTAEQSSAEASGKVDATIAGPTASASATSPVDLTEPPAVEEKKTAWDISAKGYFRAPMALGFSSRPGPDNLSGKPESQISYGPNRTVDANYYSFAYTRLQEQDWVELFVTAKSKHVDATVGWMGYWFASAGFRNYDAAWLPGVAYLTLHTDFQVGGIKPKVALSGGAWWPNFGRHEKYDTFTLGQYRQVGEQLKLTIPINADLKTELVQGFGTGRDGSFSLLAPPPYQARVGVTLLHYAHVQLNYKKVFQVGLHQNLQWTRDPNLLLQTSADKSYANARKAGMMTLGAEVKVDLPRVGKLWVSPSFVQVKNGWALGEAGVEIVHSLSPEGVATNYFGWSGSPANSTGTGKLVNLGFTYENTLANLLGGGGDLPQVKGSVFGLMVHSRADLPAGSVVAAKNTQFKWGADVEYNPWSWMGVMARFDSVNYDMDTGGYIFSAITGRLSFYSHYASGERIYLQYSRYRYGDNMTLAGRWPWGVPLVAGSDIIQGGAYAGSKPDMDVVKLQADIHF